VADRHASAAPRWNTRRATASATPDATAQASASGQLVAGLAGFSGGSSPRAAFHVAFNPARTVSPAAAPAAPATNFHVIWFTMQGDCPNAPLPNLSRRLIGQSVAVGTTLRVLLLGAVLLIATWAAMAVAARRLPPGSARDLATVLPACVTTARRLRGDPRVPRRAKVAVAVAALWVLSPIDLIPEFLPIIGPLDDVVVVALALRYAARQVPREVLVEAWPAEPRILDRLIGGAPDPRA